MRVMTRTAVTPRSERRTSAAGLGFAVISACAFGTSGSFAAALIRDGWSTGAAVTVRLSMAVLLLTAPAVLSLRGRWHLLLDNWVPVLALGLAGIGGCQLFFFNAVSHLSVSVALLLMYCGTPLVVVWMWVRHHQRPRKLTVGGGIVAIVGMVFVLDLTGAQRVDFVGVLWGLAAAVGLAAYFLASARTKDVLPLIATAWAGMVVAAVALGLCGAVGVLPLHASTGDPHLAGHAVAWWVPVAGLVLVSSIVAYTSGIAAAQLLGARLASFLGLADVVSAALFAWLLLSQRPGSDQVIGGVLVIGGIVIMRADSQEPKVAVEMIEPVPEPAG